jgi:hypothetical protein
VKLVYKRIFVMFSVALNIGFVLVAVTLAYNPSMLFKKRAHRVITDIVQRLNLSEEQESAVLESVRHFRDTLHSHDKDLKKARADVLRLLATPGPLDPARLHALVQATNLQEEQKNHIFENHAIELRNRLGDEKGALFYSYLLERLESEDRPQHR